MSGLGFNGKSELNSPICGGCSFGPELCPAILRTASDAFSLHSAPDLTHSIDTDTQPEPEGKLDTLVSLHAIFKNESKLAWGMGVLGGRRSTLFFTHFIQIVCRNLCRTLS